MKILDFERKNKISEECVFNKKKRFLYIFFPFQKSLIKEFRERLGFIYIKLFFVCASLKYLVIKMLGNINGK